MYANLGGILFEGLKGFSSFTDSRATNFAEIAMVNRKPRLQRTGESLQEINFSILLHANFSNVESDIQAFEDIREAGESVSLVLGNGVVMGDFLLTSIDRDNKKTDPLGNIIFLTASIKLKEYPSGNRAEELAITAKAQSFASSIDKVLPTKAVAIAPSVASEAGSLSIAVNVEARLIAQNTDIAIASPTRRAGAFATISAKTDVVSIAATDLANKIRAIEQEVSNATEIIDNAEAVVSFASNVKQAVTDADLSALVASNATFQGASASLYSAMSSVAVLLASRKL